MPLSSNQSPVVRPLDGSERNAGRWPGFFAVMAAAVIVRAVCLTQLPGRLPFYQSTTPGWDQDAFFHWAQRIAAGDLLSRHQGIFTYTPLYPYVLSTVCLLAGWTGGNALIGGIILNGLLGVATSLMVWSVARRFFGNVAGLAAGLLMAASGSHIAVEGMLLHDTLMTFLLVAGLWLIVRKIEPAGTGGFRLAGTSGTKTNGLARVSPAYWLLPGAAFGLAAIGRSSHLVLAAGMCLWVLAAGLKSHAGRRGLAGATVLALAAMAVAGLPAVRNGMMFGRWSSGSGGWSAVYLGIAPDAPGTLFETDLYLAAARRVDAAEDRSAAWQKELAQLVRNDPVGVSRTIGLNTLTLLNSWDAPDNGNYYFVRRYVPSFAWGTFGPLAIYVIGFGGVIVCLLSRRRGLGALYAFGLSMLASLAPAYPSGRYKLALLCLLCVFGGQAVAALVGAARQRRWIVVTGTVALWMLLAIAVWPRGPWNPPPAFQAAGSSEPWFKPARWRDLLCDSGPLRANEFQYHAAALAATGRPGEAAAMLDDGADLFPRIVPPGFDEAQAKLAAKAYDEAIEAFSRIIARHPDFGPAYTGRGWAHARIADSLILAGRRGEADFDLEQARADFSRAIELEKSDPATWYNRGTILELMNRYDESIADLTTAIDKSPNSIRYLFTRGRVHQKSGHSAEEIGDAKTKDAQLVAAIDDYTAAIRLDPARAEVYEARAAALKAAGRDAESDQDLETAKQLRRGKP